jgi:hypothetical protein
MPEIMLVTVLLAVFLLCILWLKLPVGLALAAASIALAAAAG